MPQCQFSRQTWTDLGSKTRFRDERSATMASFTRSGCRAADKFLFSPYGAVEHRKAYAYSHNPIVWPSENLPAGCLEQPELSTAMTGRRTVAQSAVLQALLTDTFTHSGFNPLNPELNPICYLLALLGAHHFFHVSRIRVKLLTLRRLMSYIYGAPILDVSRSHTTTQHSR